MCVTIKQKMKETLILSNHPQTTVIAPHVLRLLSEEKAVALTVPVLAALISMVPRKNYQSIPITKSQTGSIRMYDFFIRLFMTIYTRFHEHPYKENPIETAGDLLATGRNVLLFPSGKVYRDVKKPEPWRRGVGRVLRHAYPQNNDINIALMHIQSRKQATVSEPIPVHSLDLMNPTIDDSYADSARIARELWMLYHRYFGYVLEN